MAGSRSEPRILWFAIGLLETHRVYRTGATFGLSTGRSVSSLGFYGGMVIDGTQDITDFHIDPTPNSTVGAHSAVQSLGAGKGGIRRIPGRQKVRSSSVMSFGGTTEFGYKDEPQPMPWWQQETSDLYSMWPKSHQGKRKKERLRGSTSANAVADAGEESSCASPVSPKSRELTSRSSGSVVPQLSLC